MRGVVAASPTNLLRRGCARKVPSLHTRCCTVALGMVALGVLSGGSFGAPSVATLYAVAMLTGAGIATLVGGLALALRGARAIAARVSA